MSKLKFILFSVSYFLLFTLKSQQIEWINTYELGGREVNFSIDYSQKENQYIYSAGTNVSSIFGKLNNMGDTSYLKERYSGSSEFGLWHLFENFNQKSVLCKTFLIDTATLEQEQNITKFDYFGNIIWQTSYNIGYKDWFKKTLPLSDGGSLVTGYRGIPQNDVYLVRVGGDGTIIFENQYYANGYQFTSDLDIHHDGSYWICGSERPFTSWSGNGFMLKIDSEGDLIEKDTIPELIVGDTNGYIQYFSETPVKHLLCSWNGKDGYTLFKLDSNYNIIWQTPADYGTQHPVLLDNNKIFTYSGNVKLYDYTTGAEVWSESFPDVNGGNVGFNDHAFDDSGNVVLSARLFGATNSDLYFTK